MEGRKSKTGEVQNPSSDIKETPNLGEVDNVGKKKKRKRDEIEAEYEEKRYGAKDERGGEGKSGGEVVVGEKRKKLDNPEDMHISKDGFDDEDKLLRTVFVGNLPLKVKKKALLREFSQFGEIESVRLRSIPLLDDKTPRKGAIMKKQINDAVDRVNAYIVFKAEEFAQASLSHNMAVVGGNHIHVDRACPPRKKLKGENSPLYDNKRTVFVGNLPFDVKDEEIYQLFSSINNIKTSIEAIRVIRDPGTSMGKGIAYVLFKTREAANLVVRKHNLKIRDRELRLSHAAASNSTPSKRKSLFPLEKYSSPTKKFAADTTIPDSRNKVNTQSYQGMRASKSGVQKKVASKKRTTAQVKSDSTTRKEPKRKERSSKRPAVAARKAAASGLPSGGGFVEAGKKRKAGSRTPQSNIRHKKARKFK